MYRMGLRKLLTKFSLENANNALISLGINFITAGFVGLFVTHTRKLNFLAIGMLIWVVCFGVLLLFLGLYKGTD